MHGEGLAAEAADMICRAFRPHRVDIAADDVGAGFGHGFGELKAKALAGAGDDGDFAGQVEHF
jgi:hypothetical protein